MIKNPDQCENIREIRVEIDAIDQKIIAFLGQRFNYVKSATKFKTTKMSVKDSERFQAMLQQRRIWAENEGLNPDVIEKSIAI